jgi:dephospho-CoA kinase
MIRPELEVSLMGTTQDPSFSKRLSKRTVILIGLPGSGKTIGATYLKEFGFVSVSAGDVIRDLCRKEGLPLTRESLNSYGQQLLDTHGFQYFGEMLLQRARNHELIIFEGIRPPEVVQWLKSQRPETIVIYIESPEDIRLRRLVARGEDKYSNRLAITAAMERDIVKFKPLADVVIENVGSLNEFHQNLRDVAITFLQE